MSPQAVEGALYEALAQSRGSTADAVRAEAGAGGQIDSLEGMELVVVAEGRFGVQIADDELTAANCSSVPRLAKLVASKMTTA